MGLLGSTQPLGRSVLFGGLLAFLTLTAMISTIAIDGQSFRYLVYLMMAGYGLGIVGMALVGYAIAGFRR